MKKFWQTYGYCISMCFALCFNRIDNDWLRMIGVGIFVGLSAMFINQIKKSNEKCAQCGQEKPIEDFSKSYKNLCKACVAYNEKLKRSMRVSTEQPLGQPFNASVIQIDSNYPQLIPNLRFMASIAAMQGLLNATSVERFTLRIKPEALAQAAVEYADALINELNKKKDEVAEYNGTSV